MKALQRDPDRRYPTAAAMARDLDAIVLASRLRTDEVGALVREIITPPPPPAGVASPVVPVRTSMMACARTARDLAMPVRRWMDTRRPARGTVVTGLGLILGLTSALGLGMKLQRARDARAARSRAAAVIMCPAPTLAGTGAERHQPVAFDSPAR
jgi:hypothetical protein